MDEIQLQLQEMKQVLAHASEEDKPGLQMMIDQLEQLLHFQSEENLLTQAGSLDNDSTTNSFDNTSNTNDTEENTEDAEFRRFQEEIAAMSCSSSSNESKLLPITNDDNNATELSYEENSSLTEDISLKNELIHDELSQLEGMLCRAPFVASWGQLGYYNAIVLNVERANSDCDSLDTIFVRVVFSNPVVEHMKPCQYFMEGHCKFDEENCKFSHGEVVPLSHLKEYNEPDFQKIEKQSRVLAKYSDGLWYHATVSEIKEGGECIVKYDSYPETHTIPLHDTCFLHDDDNEAYDSSLSSSSSSDDDDDDDDENETNTLSIDQLPLMHLQQNADRLGQWEKHTKGIGSKLMVKMGYIIGTGLGRHGEGRIEPIDAVVLPQGLSLDTCMQIKEKSADQNLFSAAKKLKRQQRKEAMRAKKAEEKPKPKHESVFNFLNTKLSLTKDSKHLKKPHHVNIKELTKDSSKNLNKKALNLSENIKQVNKDIIKLKEGLKRHEGNTTVERMKSRLEGLENHLRELKKSESTIESEQRQRNDKKKLAIF